MQSRMGPVPARMQLSVTQLNPMLATLDSLAALPSDTELAIQQVRYSAADQQGGGQAGPGPPMGQALPPPP
eukprot:357027-Chlamydomonas_euryale.AAC.6